MLLSTPKSTICFLYFPLSCFHSHDLYIGPSVHHLLDLGIGFEDLVGIVFEVHACRPMSMASWTVTVLLLRAAELRSIGH